MGRKPTRNLNLPPRLRARTKARGRTWFYYDTGEKPRREIPLGSDYALAVKKWAELELDQRQQHATIVTFRYIAEAYQRERLQTKAPKTQREYLAAIAKLYEFFDDPPAPLVDIEPVHVRQYLHSRRATPISANREKATFSLLWNFAREFGYTDAPNPCVGIKGFPKGGRDIYVSDEVYNALWAAADAPLRDALDLAYLTGQRPADVRALAETAIRDGALELRQRKTKAPLRIEVKGELVALLERIRARKSELALRALALIVDEKGRPLSAASMRGRFDRARAAAAKKAREEEPKMPLLAAELERFQFRDLRAKAASDKADAAGIEKAQRQLGHASVVMTEHYVRARRGAKVDPTK